jgi:hypothetical protein
MNNTVDDCLTDINYEVNRLTKLVDTPIGNWIPGPTFNEILNLVNRFEGYLPTIKGWIAAFEANPENHTEIWLRQGLDLASSRDTWNALEHHIYKPITGFSVLDYQLDYTAQPPPKPTMTPEIEAIHEGKDCDFNGFFCWYCEDQDHALWRLQQIAIKASKNIFINTDLQELFIKAAVEANIQPNQDWNIQDYFDIKKADYECYYQKRESTKGHTYGQLVRDFIKTYIPTVQFWYNKENVSPCHQYLQIARQIRHKDRYLYSLKEAAEQIAMIINDA